MPIVSKQQNRFMRWKASEGTPKEKKMAEDFIEATPKSAYKEMPEKVKPARFKKIRASLGAK